MDNNGMIYNMRNVVDEIIETYALNVGAYERSLIRKKVEHICKQTTAYKQNEATNLWAKSRCKVDNLKKAEHRFTQSEKRELVSGYEMLKYIQKHIEGDAKYDCERKNKIKQLLNEKIELEESARQRNQATLEALENFDPSDYTNDIPIAMTTPEELRQKRLEIMIEALFLKYFTPIKDELLCSDMDMYLLVAGSMSMDNTPESEAAIKRLENPTCYYEEKE